MQPEIFYLPPEVPAGAPDEAAPYLDELQRIRVVMKPIWSSEDYVTRSITLTPRLQTVFVPGSTDGFRFSVTADEAVGLDKRIFVYQVGPTLPDGGRRARFHKIASPTDLAAMPADEPGPTDNPAWARLDSITLDFHGRLEAMETLNAVIADVRLLLKSLAYMDKLEAGTPITLTVGE